MLDETESWKKHRPLSEPELINAALNFANKATFASVIALLSGRDMPAVSDEPDSPAMKASWENDRTNFGHGLSLIAQGASVERLGLPSPHSDRMVLRPATSVERGKITTRHYYLSESLRALLTHVLGLMADSSRPYRRDLCQCKLETCGKFFLVKPNPKGTGAPRRRYCSAEHMKQANDAQVADRVRRYRKKKSEDKAAKTLTRKRK